MKCSAAPRPPRTVPARDHVCLDVLGELVDLRWCRLVQPSGVPVLGDPVPVGPVHAAGPLDTAAPTTGMWVDGEMGLVGLGGQEHAVTGGQAAAVA
jgi:hypothetical protein